MRGSGEGLREWRGGMRGNGEVSVRERRGGKSERRWAGAGRISGESGLGTGEGFRGG